jgi:hypothetical protein
VSNRKRIASIAFTGAAAAAAVGMNMGPAAAAAGTWTTSPATGGFTGQNINTATLSANGIAFTCAPGAASTAGQVSGNGKAYSPPAPTQLGTISQANFGVTNSNCKLLGQAISAQFTTGAPPYDVNGKTYHASTGVTSGSLTNISARINTKSTDSINCHLTVTGSLPGSIHNGPYSRSGTNYGSHVFAINPGNTAKTLKIKSVSGSTTFCTSLFHPGDAAAFSAIYSTNPPLTVTATS